jgi:hypothetical protein
VRDATAILSRAVGYLGCLGLLAALALSAVPGALADPGGEGRATALKVAYLYNFTRFAQWPEAALGERFLIAVVGDPILAAALKVLEGPDKRVQGRPIEVEARDPTDRVGDCQVLFIGVAALAELPRLVEQTAGRPVLLVGDGRGLAGRGVAIGLYLKPDILGTGSRLRFVIDRRALEGRGLKVSAQLYDVAEAVE